MQPLLVAAAILLLATVLPIACAERIPVGPPADPGVRRVLVDTRRPEPFAEGHRPGALNIQWGYDQLGARIEAYVPDKRTPIGLIASGRGEAEKAAAVLKRQGYVDVTLAPDSADGAELASLPLMTVAELRALLEGPDPPVVIDVRSLEEYATGTIEGALRFEQDEAPRLAEDLERDRAYAVICEGGWRSSQLASWMKREGFADVANVIDGMSAWRKQSDP